MIKTEGLTKIYTEGNTETRALNQLNLEFPDFGFVAITGPSGCGKTTLLNILSGFDGPTSGKVFIDAADVTSFTDDDWDLYRSQQMGFVFQNYNLLEDLTVRENLELPLTLERKSPDEIRKTVESVAGKADISELLDKNVKHLSGGQKQRVAILRAIAKKPAIILADEPTGNLDEKNSRQIFSLLKEIAKDCLVLVVTHDTALAEQYADRTISMSYGTVECIDGKTEIRTSLSDISLNQSNEKQIQDPLKKGDKSSLSALQCIRFALSALRKRPGRAVVTGAVLTISMTFLLVLVSVFTKNRAKTLQNYIVEKGIEGVCLYEDVPLEYAAYCGSDSKQIENGEKIHALTQKVLSEKDVFDMTYSSLLYIKGSSDGKKSQTMAYARVVAVEETDGKLVLVSGKMPETEYDLLVSESLAENIQLSNIERPVPLMQGEQESKYSIVGIVKTPVGFEDCFEDTLFVPAEMLGNSLFEYNKNLLGINIISAKGAADFAGTTYSAGRASDYSDKVLFGRIPEKKSEFAISSRLFERIDKEWNEIENKEYPTYNLRNEKYGSAFDDAISLYDICGDKITLVGVLDSDEEYLFSDEAYKQIESVIPLYDTVVGFFLNAGNVYENIRRIDKVGLKITGTELNKLYALWNEIDEFASVAFLCTLAFVLLTLLQMISLYSFSIRDSAVKIGTLRALGVPAENTKLIFMVESIITTTVSFVVSVIATIVIIGVLNTGLVEMWPLDYEIRPLIINPLWLLLTGIGIYAASTAVVIIPLNRLKKASVVNLLMGEA